MVGKEYREIILINEGYFKSLLSDIDSAQKKINLEVYIFFDDKIGKKIANALCRAAERGVKVRVMVDGIGTINWGNPLAIQMENAGIKTHIYHPVPWIVRHWYEVGKAEKRIISKLIHLISKLNSRNHRKTCTIDDKIVYVGSANITQSYLDKNESDFRETTVKLINVDTSTLNYAFEKAWGDVPFRKRLHHFIRSSSYVEPIFRLNDSLRRRRMIYKSLLHHIHYAKKRIWVTNAYFLPDNILFKKLIHAAKSGVDVRILLPRQYDVLIFSFVTKIFYRMLLEGGVSIYEYIPRMLHAKTLIIDDWYCVGSTNLNSRSIKHDLEIDVNIQTDEAKKTLEDQFLMDLEQAVKVNKNDLKKISFFTKIMGRFLLLLKHWL